MHLNAPSDERARVALGRQWFSTRNFASSRQHTACSSIALCLTCHEPLSDSCESPGRSLISEKGWVEHCASAVSAGRWGKTAGDVSSRRRSLEGRFRELLKVKRHPFVKRTVFTLRKQSHVGGGGATWRRGGPHSS